MPKTPVDLATAIFNAIDKTAELMAQILAGARVRKLEYRIEAAMDYVHVNERAGEYAGIDDARQKKLLLHLRKRIFDV